MRKFLLASVASLAVVAGPATAADLAVKAPVYKAPPPVAFYSWTGFYIGANVGYGWGKTNDDVSYLPDPGSFGAAPFSSSASLKGVLGGVQLGYNWQFQQVVFGLEADIDAAGIKGDPYTQPLANNAGVPNPTWFQSAHQEVDWLGTVRARLGFTPVDRALFYVTGGLAYGQVKTNSHTAFDPNPPTQYFESNSVWKAGWTVGAGVEWAVFDNWTAKAEYLHYDLGSQDLVANPAAPNGPFAVTNHWTTRGDLVRVGLNYRFGYAPVIAKY
jgi:outer membrane immunogenic protein